MGKRPGTVLAAQMILLSLGGITVSAVEFCLSICMYPARLLSCQCL